MEVDTKNAVSITVVANSASQKALVWGMPEPAVLYHSGTISWESGEIDKAKRLLQGALASRFELDPDVVDEFPFKLGSI